MVNIFITDVVTTEFLKREKIRCAKPQATTGWSGVSTDTTEHLVSSAESIFLANYNKNISFGLKQVY